MFVYYDAFAQPSNLLDMSSLLHLIKTSLCDLFNQSFGFLNKLAASWYWTAAGTFGCRFNQLTQMICPEDPCTSAYDFNFLSWKDFNNTDLKKKDMLTSLLITFTAHTQCVHTANLEKWGKFPAVIIFGKIWIAVNVHDSWLFNHFTFSLCLLLLKKYMFNRKL